MRDHRLSDFQAIYDTDPDSNSLQRSRTLFSTPPPIHPQSVASSGGPITPPSTPPKRDDLDNQAYYSALIPKNSDSLAAMARKVERLASIVKRNESLAVHTNFVFSKFNGIDPELTAIKNMDAMELYWYQGWKSGKSNKDNDSRNPVNNAKANEHDILHRFQVPVVDWSSPDFATLVPSGQKSRQNFTYRAQAMQKIWAQRGVEEEEEVDSARISQAYTITPENAAWLTYNMIDMLPLVKAVSKIQSAERDLAGGLTTLTIHEMAELQTIKRISSIIMSRVNIKISGILPGSAEDATRQQGNINNEVWATTVIRAGHATIQARKTALHLKLSSGEPSPILAKINYQATPPFPQPPTTTATTLQSIGTISPPQAPAPPLTTVPASTAASSNDPYFTLLQRSRLGARTSTRRRLPNNSVPHSIDGSSSDTRPTFSFFSPGAGMSRSPSASTQSSWTLGRPEQYRRRSGSMELILQGLEELGLGSEVQDPGWTDSAGRWGEGATEALASVEDEHGADADTDGVNEVLGHLYSSEDEGERTVRHNDSSGSDESLQSVSSPDV